MARKLHPAPLGVSPELVKVCFRFQINGTSDPDNILPAACMVSNVTRTSAGLFSITFIEKFPVCIGFTGSVLESTQAHDLIVKSSAGAYSATTGITTVTVVGADGSTAAEDPADNDWVYCEFLFCRRNDLAPSGALPVASSSI